MTRRPPSRPATAVVAVVVPVCVALWVANLAQGFSEFTAFLPLGVSLVGVGALLGIRAPRNPIGWLLLGWGLIVSWCTFLAVWGARGLRHHERAGPVQRWVSVTMPVLWHPGFILFILAMLLFPHGRFLSRRWKVVGVGAFVLAVLLAVFAALSPRSALDDYIPGVAAPYVSPAEGWAGTTFNALLSFMLVGVLTGVASTVVRWRRASGDDRRQVTAFVFPTATALSLFAVSVGVIGNGELGFLLLPVLPISLTVAVTRYKLYEIDTIVSRTVAYALITAVVAGVFIGSVQLVGLLLPHVGSVDVAAATLAAVVVIAPVRRRVQRFVDRRFNRTRYDRERLVETFRARLRTATGLPAVEVDLLTTVGGALQPASSSVWIRP